MAIEDTCDDASLAPHPPPAQVQHRANGVVSVDPTPTLSTQAEMQQAQVAAFLRGVGSEYEGKAQVIMAATGARHLDDLIDLVEVRDDLRDLDRSCVGLKTLQVKRLFNEILLEKSRRTGQKIECVVPVVQQGTLAKNVSEASAVRCEASAMFTDGGVPQTWIGYLQRQFVATVKLFGIMTIYLLVGTLFFYLVENWSVIDSLYFSMVTMSTVGYGDISPTTQISKCFTVLYIFIGVTVVFARLSMALSGALEGIENGVLEFLDLFDSTEKGVSGRQRGLSGSEHDLTGDGVNDFVSPPGPIVFWSQGLVCGTLVLLLLQVISAFVFQATEPDLSYGDALYHCWVTATTVGYGDVKLSTNSSKLWAVFHILLSVTWLAAFISHFDSLKTTRESDLKREKLLTRQLQDMGFITEMITKLDKDKQGLDKAEFIVGMLMFMGAELSGRSLEWKDVEPFIRIFNNNDKDGNGRITMEDMDQVFRERQNALRANLVNSLVKTSPAAVYPVSPSGSKIPQPQSSPLSAPPLLTT